MPLISELASVSRVKNAKCRGGRGGGEGGKNGVDGRGTYMEVDRDWMSRNLLS